MNSTYLMAQIINGMNQGNHHSKNMVSTKINQAFGGDIQHILPEKKYGKLPKNQFKNTGNIYCPQLRDRVN